MADLLIDTNILIDVGRNKPPGLEFILSLANSRMGISAMTQFELLAGCRDKQELRKVEKALQRFELLKLSEPISDLVTRLLQRYTLSHGLQVADACIAATAVVHRIPLATGNQRDFKFIRGLRVVAYP